MIISNIDELLKFLQKKATLITSNTRLSEYLQNIYQEYCLLPPKTPQIFSYETWLHNQWENDGKKYYPELKLISHQQAHIIWEEIIRANNSFFFNVSGVIREVKKAWKLCKSWEISIAEETFVHQGSLDTSMFYEWVSAYQKKLNENHWIDLESVPELLKKIDYSAISTIDEKKTIILAGFDHLPKGTARFLNHISHSKVLVYENFNSHHTQKNTQKNVQKIAFLSEEEEINAFIDWVKNEHKNQNTHKKNTKNFGCIIPNIPQKRQKLERILKRHFEEKEYNISAGYIFSECTMISQALKILSLNLSRALLKDFYFILDSPYFGQRENQKRACAMKAIHAWGNELLSLNIFLHILKKHQVKLADSIEQYIHFSKNNKKKRIPSEWITIFQEQLQILCWPGFYDLNSVEYQTHQRWLALLEEYQQMDMIFNKISYKKALFLLKQMARQVVFQAQKKQPYIHFLGLLEASGLHFDKLWIMGMNDDNFPDTVRLNPFIPHIIQRQQQLPHATPEVEMVFADKLMQHFMNGGNEVIISYLSQKEDTPAFETPFIRDVPLLEERAISSRGNFLLTPMEYIQELEDLPCTPDENIKGGTMLIKNQALCPFRAFVKHRLKAENFESLTIGLNIRERGNLVHKALEKFWAIMKTQQNLLNYSANKAEELDEIIHKTALKTVQHFSLKKPEVLSHFFQELEIKRLEQLLKKWIEYEKTRPSFMIDALEKKKTLELSSLTLSMRADRVDILSSGEKIVIDYKTGTLPALSYDDRPENPQLLLYALSDNSIKAWAFAQVKPDFPVLKGKSAEDLDITSIKCIEWETERQHWKESLTALADEFIQGKHTIAPKKEATCNHCDLQGVCRIYELKE